MPIPKADKVGWCVVLFLAALALAMFFTAVSAHASAPTLTERIVAVQPSLASRTDEPVDAAELASAIVAVPKLTRDWAALILTIGGHESALSARIAAGNCRPRECDHGAAWGLFQSHKNKLNADVWGSPDIRVQTLEAAAMLRRAFYTCNGGGGPLRRDWVARTINAYAGHSCDAVWSGLEARLTTFARVRGRL
jgi:hypothetical protein